MTMLMKRLAVAAFSAAIAGGPILANACTTCQTRTICQLDTGTCKTTITCTVTPGPCPLLS
jgi:hypothetical protein